MPRVSGSIAAVATLLVCATGWMEGQVASTLEGRVADPTGSSVAGASVVLTRMGTGTQRTVETTADGLYTFPQIEPGKYSVQVTAAGFSALMREGVTVLTGSTTRLDLALATGAVAQEVTVTADAPLLQASQSDIQTTIPGSEVIGLPLNGRNFIQLATLAPGVSLPPGTLLPRINGGRPRTNEYLFDGISALQPEPGQVAFFPIVDDIAEFTVEADNVPAEFGRFNGGVVNVSTRSGSNAVHFSLYDFFRNEALNARNYFSTTGRKPEYRRNQYGGTLGAPVWRDHVFFFGGYQGQKLLEGITRISTIPTLAQRRGVFTTPIYDPASTTLVNGVYRRRQFANNTINRAFDPAAQAVLALLPTPTNLSSAVNNYSRTANDADHQNQFDARVDVALGARDRGFARYSYFHDVENPVTPFAGIGGAITGTTVGTGNVSGLSNVLGQQAVVNETHLFGLRSLNDVRAGYTRRSNNISGATLPGSPLSSLGIPGIPSNGAFSNAFPLFTISGYQQVGPSAGTFSQYQTGVWEVVETFATTVGRHSLKVGFDDRWYQLNAVAPSNPAGAFAFATTETSQPGVAGTGNAFASFLLGQVDTFSIDLQQSKIRPRDFIEEYFAQDDWRVTPRLTLNLGARWTLHHPSVEKNNQGAVFNLQTQQLDYLGVDGNPRSARELHYDNVAPRLGFTYELTPKTVVRSGFGIVFIDQSGITTPFTTPQFPFIQNVAQRSLDSVNAAFTLSSGPTVSPIALTPNAGLGQSVYSSQRALGSGYVQQWNLAVQRALTNNLSVDVAYVGSHIVHVGIPDQNLNQLTAAQLQQGGSTLQQSVTNPYYGQLPVSSSIGGKTVSRAQLLKPYPRFQNVAYYRNNTGNANYNALEAKVEQRLSHGLTLLASYTYSKLMDDASSVFSSTVLGSPNTSSLVAADTYRPYLERDASNGDTPNVTSISALYQIPSVHNGWLATGVPKTVLGGWSVNAIGSAISGMPVTVTQATNFNAFAGFVLQRPNVVGKTNLPAAQRSPSHFFNTAAFQTAPAYTIGTASRNPVRGPAYRDLDLAAVKHTSLGERFDLEFRAEIFNITNTPAFAQPSGSYIIPTVVNGVAQPTSFGTTTSTVTDPRVVQFALRLSR